MNDAFTDTKLTAAPGTRLVNPLEYFAAIEGGDFVSGDYLQLDQKLGWVRGEDKRPVGATEAFVAHVQNARHGHIKFGDPPERRTVRIMDSPNPPLREDCGDNDPSSWTSRDGRDPWQPVVYLPLRSISDPDDILCFTGTGKGARKAVGQVCGIATRPGADRDGKGPVLTLAHKTLQNGTAWPIFRVISREYFIPGQPAPPVQLVAVPITVAKPGAPAQHDNIDDTVPF